MPVNVNSRAHRRGARHRAIANTALLCLLWLVATCQTVFANAPVDPTYFQKWWMVPLGIWLALLLLFFAVNVRPTGVFLLKCLLSLICSIVILVVGYRILPQLYVPAQIPVFGPIALTLSILITIGILCVLRILEQQDPETVQSVARLVSFGHIVWTTWQDMSSTSTLNSSSGNSTGDAANEQEQKQTSEQQDQGNDLEKQ